MGERWGGMHSPAAWMNRHLPALGERALIKCRQGGVLLAVQKGAGYKTRGTQKLREAMHKGVFQCVFMDGGGVAVCDAVPRLLSLWSHGPRPGKGADLPPQMACCRLSAGMVSPSRCCGLEEGRGNGKGSMLAAMPGSKQQVKATHDGQRQHSAARSLAVQVVDFRQVVHAAHAAPVTYPLLHQRPVGRSRQGHVVTARERAGWRDKLQPNSSTAAQASQPPT